MASIMQSLPNKTLGCSYLSMKLCMGFAELSHKFKNVVTARTCICKHVSFPKQNENGGKTFGFRAQKVKCKCGET
jgi:hypothetical protein